MSSAKLKTFLDKYYRYNSSHKKLQMWLLCLQFHSVHTFVYKIGLSQKRLYKHVRCAFSLMDPAGSRCFLIHKKVHFKNLKRFKILPGGAVF